MTGRSPIEIMIDKATGYEVGASTVANPQKPRSLTEKESEKYGRLMNSVCTAAEGLRRAAEKRRALDWHIRNVILRARDLAKYEAELSK